VKDANSHRDEAVGRLLPGALDAHAASASVGACLDAATLAQWADETLDRDARRSVEAHAADCARCQALLAAMVRSAPAAAPIAAPFWRRGRTLGWLVPLTTAAAAAIVWTMVPPRQAPIEGNEKPAARSEAPAPAAEPMKETLRDAKRDQAKDALKSGAPSARVPERNALAKQEERAQAAENARAPAANEAVQPTPPLPAATGGALDSALRRAAPQAQSAAAPRAFALAASAVPSTIIIVSPIPASRWRILPGGGVEHSTDGGATWEPQQTGSTITLTAGAAPSGSVCWLVGPGGIVLLSTDGRTWRRITFPESADLVAVRATDDKSATVTLAAGTTYSTADGGQTWQTQP
jgi:hypothetical protein